ncbi:MAG: hypothetical protein K0R05_3844 [Anaerocolumna sp.]|jgi:hypothetical protein|nr:hypothetical protein [Anaerocolumna sp.]
MLDQSSKAFKFFLEQCNGLRITTIEAIDVYVLNEQGYFSRQQYLLSTCLKDGIILINFII